MKKGKDSFYNKYVKRILDFLLALVLLFVLFPVLLLFSVVGFLTMKGNPFFVQERPGLNEKIFKLVKFRTMTQDKDEQGELLPDVQRLNTYGKFLRSTSIDELPELINILKGDMSFIGPRPLAVQYLPYYTDEERKRHTVMPGLAGWAQVHGRNAINWEERFAYDIEYVDKVSFFWDLRIVFMTVSCVIKRSDIGVRGVDAPIDFDVYRARQKEGGN